MTTGAIAPNHSAAFRQRRFANWFPLGFTYAALYMGRYNFNVSKEAIGGLYHLSKTDMGIVATAGFWTYGLSVLINGPLADRLGGRKAILFGTFGACLLNLAIGAMFKIGWDGRLIGGLSLLYAINMYFQSFGALSIVKINSSWFHVRERGVLGGVFGSMISLGYYLAYGICGYFVEHLPLWAVYVIPSGVLLTMHLVERVLVRNRPSEAGFEDFDTGDGDGNQAAADEDVSVGYVLRRVLLHPVLQRLAIAEFCTGLVRQGLLLYFPEFLKEVHHLTKSSAGFQIASAGITVGGVCGALLCGVISDRVFHSRRAPVAFIFYLGQIASLLVLGWVTSANAAAFMIPVCAMWIFGVHGMLSGTASMDFGGKRAAATAAGLLDGVQYIGAGLTGIGLGWVLDNYHWGVWTYTLIPFSAIGAFVMLTLWNAQPGKTAH